MAIFKCKMCGGPLNVEENVTVLTCEYCNTCQTLPRLQNDKRSALYERAGAFRRSNEFDKAEALYEQILSEDTTDAEAYWSLVLCRFGIEYVTDPATRRRIPTVNRAQLTSIFEDPNYLFAIKYADEEQKKVYEQEARTIHEVQKRILAISEKEEPFDVFICYKQTDENGNRTPDSVLANDLYHQLTREGYKVFFAAITLESKLGSAYEPYIFSALRSAKVMVVLGTKPEYFNAAWVKNEWSRFLRQIREGEEKILIPAYRDMDPYDLPEEFSHLQAQDMAKLGFMQDLIYGIKKIVRKEEKAPAASAYSTAPAYTATPYPSTGGSGREKDPMLKRARIFLEDGDWNSAESYAEKVLDLDPECGEAYLIKLLARLRLPNREKLTESQVELENFDDYKKAMRFGDVSLTSFLLEAARTTEQNRAKARYDRALGAMESANTPEDYHNAAALFHEISAYLDADQKEAECLYRSKEARLALKYREAEEQLKKNTNEGVQNARNLFLSLSDYRDAALRAEECVIALECLKREQAEIAAAQMREVFRLIEQKSFSDAAKMLKGIERLYGNNVQVYIARLLINYKVKDEKELAKQPVDGNLKENPYYQKIMELGDPETVERFREIERKMLAVRAGWRPIGWLLGLFYLAASTLPVLLPQWTQMKLSFIPTVLLMAAPMMLYVLLTKLFEGQNQYGPGSYFLGFGFGSVVTDVIVMIVTGNFNLFFTFVGNKLVQAVVWFVGFSFLRFENYGDYHNQNNKA